MLDLIYIGGFCVLFKIWLISTRPWSFTATFIPVALGTALAWIEGSFSMELFLLTLIGGICIQAGTNLINTYGDFIAGVDTVESAKNSSPLVAGLLKPKSMKRAGIAAFAIASILGLVLTYLSGWPVFALGLIGIVAGYCYTAGIYPYKYAGLGSIFVFFLMGPFMVWSAYYIQAGNYSWTPILASLPVGLLVAGILHANDVRDFVHDQKAGIKTLALNIGFQNSMVLYYTLYMTAYLCLIVMILENILPWTAILPLVLIPVVINMFRYARDAANGAFGNMRQLEAKAAGFHFQFGMLLVMGVLVSSYIDRWFHW